MSKHTEGPWKMKTTEDGFEILMDSAIRSRGHYRTHHKIEMSFCLYPDDGPQYREALANARLMAAAPDLLAALIECEAMLDEFDASSARTQRIRAAIAKATHAKAGGGENND